MSLKNLLASAVLLLPALAMHPQLRAEPSQMAVPHPAAELRDLVRHAMAADHVPAYAVAVVQCDRLIMDEAHGLANLETRTAAAPKTRFRIGSLSKVFTATLAARLAQQHRIDLDRRIREYLPAWPARHPPITLRQLLGHTAGIRHYIPRDADYTVPGGPIDLRVYSNSDSVLAVFAQDDLISLPGTEFHYSTFGVALAGLVIEAATGRDYFSLLKEEVLGPARLNGISIDHYFAIMPNRAAPYDPIEAYQGLPSTFGPVVNAAPLNSAYKLAAGGLIADAQTVARFGALFFSPGFLDEKVFRETFTPQRLASGKYTEVGLGWYRGTDAGGRRYFQHTGSQQGSRAVLTIYPRERLSVAILGNLRPRPGEMKTLGLRASSPLLRNATPCR